MAEKQRIELSESIREAIRQALLQTHVAMPCTVTAIKDPPVNTVSVQPGFQRKFVGRDPEDLPEVHNVPIGYYRAGNSFIKLPIKVGDAGFLVVQDRAIDKWVTLGEPVDPKDPRMHDLSDAVFVPMLSPLVEPMVTEAEASDLEVRNTLGRMIISKDGKFQVGITGVDLLGLVDELIAALQAALVATALGPQPLDPATQVKLATIKVKLASIKGA